MTLWIQCLKIKFIMSKKFITVMFPYPNCSNIHSEEERDFIKRTAKYMLDWKVNKVVSEWRIFYNKNKNLKPSKIIEEFYKVLFN